ncbi:sugar phosphate isomerase/epimerase family protein [Collimonas humicola]|uniref:sugar phosphate isomerase/epimerase family protein n=1 Tax=Collimonas humicola TaxID=2825886 RepID=UPI001B8CFA76|nr:TIM barrel protein [Collimonas humicola]
MRLAISNIAWDPAEDEAIATLLQNNGVDAIDVAPSKYFPVPAMASNDDIAKVKNWWSERGIEITGMQALLFGTNGMNLFGSLQVQEQMLQYLNAVCRIGAGLGAKRLVFGSPKNRDRSGLSDQDTTALAIAFFRRLGDIAQSYDVLICLEANPTCYGANFMTTTAETMQMVTLTAHPSIKLQFDIGALTINGEDSAQVLKTCAPFIGHIHISEPDLLPLGDGPTNHANVANALECYLPRHVTSIEMLATKSESHLISVERALSVAIRYYR